VRSGLTAKRPGLIIAIGWQLREPLNAFVNKRTSILEILRKGGTLSYEQILYEPGLVARVILNRPRYRNAQSRVLLEEMDDAFTSAVTDNEVRVIVLSGAGDHFSAGHDLGTPEERADREKRGYAADPPGRYLSMKGRLCDMHLRWRNLPKPTIAMVQGYCIFGGWMIASAMDLIFSSEDALFLPSLFQYFSVPWDLGPRKTKELLFEHRFVTAQEAWERGLVNRVYPREKLEEETLAYAQRVAQSDPFRLRLIKFAVNQMQDTMGFSAAVQAAYETYYIGAISRSAQQEAAGTAQTGPRFLADAERALKNLEEWRRWQRED